jgi:hypothetical protein
MASCGVFLSCPPNMPDRRIARFSTLAAETPHGPCGWLIANRPFGGLAFANGCRGDAGHIACLAGRW